MRRQPTAAAALFLGDAQTSLVQLPTKMAALGGKRELTHAAGGVLSKRRRTP